MSAIHIVKSEYRRVPKIGLARARHGFKLHVQEMSQLSLCTKDGFARARDLVKKIHVQERSELSLCT